MSEESIISVISDALEDIFFSFCANRVNDVEALTDLAKKGSEFLGRILQVGIQDGYNVAGGM